MKENLILINQILLKSILMGFFVLLLWFWVYLIFNEQMIYLFKVFYNVPEEMVSSVFIITLGVAKSIILFGLVIPVIAIHWTLKKMEKAEAS